MENITKYRAKDKTEFTSEVECIEYERLLDMVDRIMSRLQPKPKDDGCSFPNGNGFIQHEKSTVVRVWNALLDEFSSRINHEWISHSKDMKYHSSYVGRLVDDYGISPYNKAWYRMQCIDKQFREFGQPYYVENPQDAKLFQITGE